MTAEALGTDDGGQQTRAAAFRLLLETGRAVSAAQIAAATKALLSAAPAAHEIWLGSRRLWTWCAYDVVGIVGTLGADARSLSHSPATGAQIRLQFAAGEPRATPGVVFFSHDPGAVRTHDGLCSTPHLFRAPENP